MTDALFGTLVMLRLGTDYEAWTRTGTFQYLSPGRSGLIRPDEPHHVELVGRVSMRVDFYDHEPINVGDRS